jgi:hypothetical protein
MSAVPNVPAEQIRKDIFQMVGGHFNGVSLGLDAYNEILERARAHAEAYLDLFADLFLGPNFNPIVQADLYLPLFLDYLKDVAPQRVKALAEQLLKQYDAVLAFHDAATDRNAMLQLLPEDVRNLSHRFEDRRRELRAVLYALGQP